MAEAYEPRMSNHAQVKLLVWDCELMERRHGLLLSWPWQKWRGIAQLLFHKVHGGVSLQTHDLQASNGGDAMKFWCFATYHIFSQLGVVVQNENGRHQMFKQEFKRRFIFSQVSFNSQVGSQVAPFHNLIRKLQKWILNLRNGTHMPGGTFADCENFRKLNSGLVKLSFEDFASQPPFS